MSTPFANAPSSLEPSAVLNESTTLPLIEESVVVKKRRVETGGYRITKRVNAREEIVDESLTSQHVEVERRLIGQLLASTEVPVPRQEGDTWIVPVVEEVLVTEKRLLLKEEIRITRSDRVHRQSQNVSLRSEEISIERLDLDDSSDIVSS